MKALSARRTSRRGWVGVATVLMAAGLVFGTATAASASPHQPAGYHENNGHHESNGYHEGNGFHEGNARSRGAAPLEVDQNGVCEQYEACLYYDGNHSGSMRDYFFGQADLAGDVFLSAGDGKGKPVKNDAASAQNRDPDLFVCVYYNENFSGPSDQIPRNGWENLDQTWNNDASLGWISAGETC